MTAMPWVVRKAASVLFATPPTSTFEEASADRLRVSEYTYELLFCRLLTALIGLKKVIPSVSSDIYLRMGR